MYWLRKSLFPSADSHLKTVALSGISTSAQIARRLSPSAMRLQIASPSSVVNNDGCPTGRLGGFMGLDQFDRGAHLAPYYARRLCGARVSPRSRSKQGLQPRALARVRPGRNGHDYTRRMRLPINSRAKFPGLRA